MAEIIPLQNHVVEFEEGHRLLALQPHLHRIERQHAVDGEMRPHPLQHLDIADLPQPIVVVDHHRIGRPIAKYQEPLERGADRGDVGLDRRVVQHLANLVLAGGIADPRGPATHQDDRLVPRLLQPAQQHDRHQIADMQRRRRRIEPHIGRHHLPPRQRIEPAGIGDLMNIAALVEQLEQGGGVLAHRWGPLRWRGRFGPAPSAKTGAREPRRWREGGLRRARVCRKTQA